MATKKLSKAKREIITQVRERWTNTVLDGKPDIEKAKTCLIAAYQTGIGAYKVYETIKKPVFHVVESPLSFGIAHAVKRGRMSKRKARELCFQLGIDYAPFADMRRDKTLRWRQTPPRWYAHTDNEFSRTWLRLIDETHRELETRMAAERNTGIRRRRWGGFRVNGGLDIDMRINSFDIFVPLSRSTICDSKLPDLNTTNVNVILNSFIDSVLLGSNSTQQTLNTLDIAYRPGIERIKRALARDDEDFAGDDTTPTLRHEILPEDAEICCRLMGTDDPRYTWEYEVFHHLTAFAAFEESCIILAARPKMTFDDENNLHNETGPAIEWPDGAKLWFNHGHFLDEYGKDIITAPQSLTTEKILGITNEETRRVAIDRLGWEKFLVEADCPVLDRRQNDIDNTIEMLVGPPAREKNDWRRTNKMVLFCRSTGRRYLLNVPFDVMNCAEAQHWMANANRMETNRIPYASHEMRLIGAS